MNILSAAGLVLAHYDDIVAAVTFAEKFLPAGAGADKLEFVRKELQSNADLAAKLKAGEYDALWPYVAKVITLLVKYVIKKAA